VGATTDASGELMGSSEGSGTTVGVGVPQLATATMRLSAMARETGGCKWVRIIMPPCALLREPGFDPAA
jgi:hypothetical protein